MSFRQIVEDDNFVASIKHPFNTDAPDVAGAACHKNLHWSVASICFWIFSSICLAYQLRRRGLPLAAFTERPSRKRGSPSSMYHRRGGHSRAVLNDTARMIKQKRGVGEGQRQFMASTNIALSLRTRQRSSLWESNGGHGVIDRHSAFISRSLNE